MGWRLNTHICQTNHGDCQYMLSESSLITDRLKNEMGRALLGIDDEVAGGSRSIGKVRVCESDS